MRHLLQACAKNAQQCLATMIYSIYEAFNPTSTPTFMIAKFKTIYQKYHSLNLLTMSLLDFQLFNTIKNYNPRLCALFQNEIYRRI